MKVKNDIMRKAFKEIGQKMLESQGFKDWFAKAEFWVRPYGLFCKLRDFFGTANHGNAPPPPRTKWTRRVPHPVLIGHAASITPQRSGARSAWAASRTTR